QIWLENELRKRDAMTWIEICMNASEEGLDWICTALATPATSAEIQISAAASPDWQFQVQIYLAQTTPHRTVDQIQTALIPMQRTGMISPPETYLTDQKQNSPPPQQQIGRFILAPSQPLSAEQIALLRSWIDQGAKGEVKSALAQINWQP
ncbi:MAG: hypothetical protein HC767_06265, partial [Akkermansiaceae bacterium]|nr:hypothetical protein [Akkermansiaceae bacterium]